MNNNLTEMVFIIDMSGSMSRLSSDTIGGYNTLINQQKEEKGSANVTTVLFDDRYIMLYDNTDIKDIPEMTSKEYQPCGCTALLDAVGKTINSIGARLNNTPEDEKPSKVVFTIITDGYENSSVEYSWDKVKEMITHQREKYNWIFTFIGANIDTMEVSNNLGIDSKLSKSFTASAQGASSVFLASSKAMSYTRSVDVNNLSKNVVTDGLSDILDEVE